LSVDFFDIKSAPQQQLSSTTSPRASEIDPFHTLNPVSSSSDSKISRGGSAMSFPMSQKLNPLKKAFISVDQALISNSNLQITYNKYYGGDRTIIALFLSNLTPSPLASVAIQFEPSAGLALNFEGDPFPQAKGNLVIVGQIAAGATVTQLVMIQCRDVSCAKTASSSLTGQASYHGISSLLRFNVSIDLFELLRPYPINTDKFGSMWKSFNQEKKIFA